MSRRGLSGLVFPFLPRHLTLVSSLTIGIPAFLLALQPNNQRVRPNIVPRVLRFAVPSGLVAAAASYTAYSLAIGLGTQTREQTRTAAVISLFIVAYWIMLLVARPLNRWRAAMAAAMAAVFVAVLVWPLAAEFFALDVTRDGLVAAVVCGGTGAAVLELGAWLLRRRGGDTRR